MEWKCKDKNYQDSPFLFANIPTKPKVGNFKSHIDQREQDNGVSHNISLSVNSTFV